MNTRRLVTDAVLIALYVVLNFYTIRLGCRKPVLLLPCAFCAMRGGKALSAGFIRWAKARATRAVSSPQQ